MPELPEVETVKNKLKEKILHQKIQDVQILYPNIIEYPTISEFQKQIKSQTINDIKRRGKWLLFELDDYYLLSHLRMEGKYIIRMYDDIYDKHEHIGFLLDNHHVLRYKDTRKFGRMHLIKKEEIYRRKPLSELGLEPFDKNLTFSYLKEKYRFKKLPIKTVILDQSIITGIGNIYADEILFLSHIHPLKKASELTDKELKCMITYTKQVLDEAIKQGGTTIRSYESSEGVHGRFQQNLLVHNQEGKDCPICHTGVVKIKVGGRGTYYCPTCQFLD